VSDLVAAGRARLERGWDQPVELGTVEVAFEERAVFRSTAPDGRPVVVKVDTLPSRFHRESAALQSAAAEGVRVPAIVWAEAGRPTILVLEAVDGVSLSADSPRNAWSMAGRELRRLHDVTPPPRLPRFDHREASWREFVLWWAGDACEQALDSAWLGRAAAQRVRDLMVGTFERMSEPDRRLLHGDLTPPHVLMDVAPTRVAALIDFGDSGTGDPTWDLIVLTLWRAEMLEAVLDGYGTSPELVKHLGFVGPAYRVLRHLAAAGWLAEHGFDPAKDVEMAIQLS